MDIVHAIQLALAPAFLLAGIAGLLGLMVGRLGRIADRHRRLAESPDIANMAAEWIEREIHGLARRGYCVNAAIISFTVSALLVCVVIAMLFLEVLVDLPLKWLVGIIFFSAMMALITGLVFFLREVQMVSRIALRDFRSSGAKEGQQERSLKSK